MTLSPLIGREEGKSRRKRYKFIHFPGLTGSEPVLAPKGVYKTASGFRVQLNVGSPQSQRKFSRNAPVVHDALWLYEIAILMADSPHELSSMLNNGNYISMKSLKVSVSSYYLVCCAFLYALVCEVDSVYKMPGC